MKIVLLMISFCFPVLIVGAQESSAGDSAPDTPYASNAAYSGTIPQNIQKPSRSEALRYPVDVIIGEIGKGGAPDALYTAAKRLLQALIDGDEERAALSPLKQKEEGAYLTRTIAAVKAIYPRRFRIGGGREENDGAYSFILRILGRDKWMSGELFFRQASGGWQFDDLILEEAKDNVKGGEVYDYDFSPYQRFY